jgi:RNA polymerase sigma-70 factor (ECF subfamily)
VAAGVLDQVFRREWPRMLATLIRYTGSLELAEDCLQEAMLRATTARDRELLINPGAWITTVAKRIAVDSARRDAVLRTKLPLLAAGEASELVLDDRRESPIGDDRLGLLFVACAPELAPETRLALALRFVCGIPTVDIADAMLVSHPTMSARLTRAKRQIERSGIRFAPPDGEDDADRLRDVLATVHVLYTLGHTAFDGEQLGSRPVATTAIDLARALRTFAPTDSETTGLLALLLLTDARTTGRVDDHGAVVTLEHADRRLWRRDRIDEGLELAALALPGGGQLALQAGISGLHSSAPTWAATDWGAICSLYDRLVDRWPAPSALLARVIARSFLLGPQRGLDELADLEADLPASTARQALAARADMLGRLGRVNEARDAYIRARSFERNGPIRGYYGRRIDELTASDRS